MPATNSFENDIINHFLRGQSVSESIAYLALSTTTPNEDGTNFTEPVGNGYARQPLGLGVPTTGTASNGSQIVFGPATASWGTITYLGIFFQSSGGDLKLYKNTTSRSVGSGGSITFDAGIIAALID